MSDISHVLRTVDDLAKRVQALEEENKQLKRQLRPSTAGAAYPDREGTDGDGRQLPYLGGLPGDPVALEAIESELRYLAKRLDNNAAEDEKAKQLQETRDEQQDELIKMEFLKIKREVEKCAQSSDVRKVKNTLTEKLDELLEDASLIARQQCELSTENFQQDITSLSKISEKSMHAVDTLEARCVELESKLADYDVRHSDLASASSKLAMEQKRIDEKARKALRGSLDLDAKSMVASKDVLARVSVLEARLDDAFPPHRRRRRRTGVDGTDIWTGSTDSLEDLAMDYASLRDVELLKRALVGRLSENEDQQEKSIKSMRRARELDQEALAEKLKSADSSINDLTERLVKGEVKRESIERKLRGSLDELVNMRELRDRVKKCEYDHEKVTDTTVRLTASIAECCDDRVAGNASLEDKLKNLSTLINSRVGKMGDDLLEQGMALTDRVNQVQDTTNRSIRIAENAEKRSEICEENVQQVSAKALRSVAETRESCLDAVNAATNEVRICVAKADKLHVSIEERWSEHERDYDDAMARLHRSLVAQAVAVKQIKHMAGSAVLKDMAGDRLDAILDEHVAELAKHCVEAESAVISEREMSLPVNEPKWLAATVQHCSEALATRADLECLRGLIGHVEPPETSDLWDQQLEKNRARLLRSFCERLDEAAAKLHPTNDHMAEATRRRFNERLKLCLRVGLSKHDPVRPNMTLFGKTKLGPACVACDRPFDEPTDADRAITQMKGSSKEAPVERRPPRLKKGTIVQRAAARGPDEMFFPDVGSPVR